MLRVPVLRQAVLVLVQCPLPAGAGAAQCLDGRAQAPNTCVVRRRGDEVDCLHRHPLTSDNGVPGAPDCARGLHLRLALAQRNCWPLNRPQGLALAA